jgi:sugar lactone lactonase YvrE
MKTKVKTKTKIQMLAASLLALILVLPATALSQPPLRRGEVESFLALPTGHQPEGIAVSHRGAVYVGNRVFDGATITNQILAVNNDGVATVFATLPDSSSDSEGLLGLAIDRSGNLYAAFASFDPATQGVYTIGPDGGDVERLTGSEAIAFPNGLTLDTEGRLYASDSTGAIWRYANGMFTNWAQDPLLEPFPDDPFGFPLPGANGIGFFHRSHALYVANTERSMLLRIDIAPDGSAGPVVAVTPEFSLLLPDGIAVDVHGNVHAVLPGFSLFGTPPLVQVDTATGVITPTVTDPAEAAKFDTPASIAFGKRHDSRSVYVTNADLPVVPGGPGPGVVRVGVGVLGSPR